MLDARLRTAFTYIQPSPDFEDRTLARLRKSGRGKGHMIRNVLISGGITAAACLAVVCTLIFVPWHGLWAGGPAHTATSAVTTSGVTTSALLQHDGNCVYYEELGLPPDDALDFSGETFGAETYSVVCKMAPDHTRSLGESSLVVTGTIEGVRCKHYYYDEAAALQSEPEQRLQYQVDTIVYDIRVEKIFGAREEAAHIQTGDVIVTENQLIGMVDAAMAQANQRMQQGHQYIIMIAKGDDHLISDKGIVTKESPYYVAGDLAALPLIELTPSGDCLFNALGWGELLTADAVPVVMPESVERLPEEGMYLRTGDAFAADLQRLVDEKLLLLGE